MKDSIMEQLQLTESTTNSDGGTMTMEDNGRGGAAWRYQCKRCAHEVDLLAAFPETCPGCGASGWWGKLTAKERHDTIPAMSEGREGG